MKCYRSIQTIKALSFDLDDTLYENHSVIKKAEASLHQWLGKKMPKSLDFTDEHWQQFTKQVLTAKPEFRSHLTEKRRETIKLAAASCGFSISDATMLADEAMVHFLFERSNFEVPKASLEILMLLAKQYPLVAITNGNVDLDKLGLTPFFTQILKAGFDGEAKPHRQMFDKAREFLALPAASILHVGDNLLTDVAGAKQAGFSACWLNPDKTPINAKEKARTLPDIEIHHLEQLITVLR